MVVSCNKVKIVHSYEEAVTCPIYLNLKPPQLKGVMCDEFLCVIHFHHKEYQFVSFMLLLIAFTFLLTGMGNLIGSDEKSKEIK